MKFYLKISIILISGTILFLTGLFGNHNAATPAAAQGPDGPDSPLPGPFVSKPVTPRVVNIDLRTLPVAKPWQPGDPVSEVPRQVYARPESEATYSPPLRLSPDPLLALQESAPPGRASSAFSTPALNFEGISFTGVQPPDTVGDVGPNHYIQMVNSGAGASVQVFDKAGNSLVGPFELASLWTAGGDCATGKGDPIVLYDRLAGRWLLSEFANAGNHLCVYVSQTPNPVSGGWYLYDFTTPEFPDYPKYAVWPDAYYVSSNESSGPAVYALDRNQMLNGAPATSQRFMASNLIGFGFQALIPSDLDGAASPPAGAPNIFMRHRDDEAHNPGSNNPAEDYLEVWEFHVDWTTPSNSTFAKTLDIPVSEFDSDLCGLSSFDCFPQPGTATTLDPLREVLMWRLQYRNFGDYEMLVGNLVTDVDGTDHGGIRWFELRRTGGGAWSLFQEGTYAPDAAHRWMGSIAMDGSGNIALGYSVSDASSIYPSIRYTGRLANDPAGALPQGEHTIRNGVASQTSGTRWGDYSAMSVDPADDCTFWYTNEYLPLSGNWQTRIAAFKFDECGAADFTLAGDPPALEVCAPADAVYTVSVGSLLGFSDPVTLNAGGYPAGTSAAFGDNPITPADPPATTTLTIANTGAATVGSHTINVVGVAPTSTHTSTVRLDIFDSIPGGVTLDAPANGAANVSAAPTFTWTAASQSGSYLLEIAADAAFNTVVYSATVAGTSHTLAAPLNTNTRYTWRVQAHNACGAGSPSASYTFTTEAQPGDCEMGTTPNTLFSDDFESGASGWSHTGTNDTWTLSSNRPHSGSYTYYAEGVSIVSDQHLISPPVVLPADESPLTLQFWNHQTIESNGSSACWDGAIIEISTNGGSSWGQLEAELLTDPYDGVISSSAGNPLGGLNAWCGEPQDWLESVIDLDAYAGQTVNFRFRLGTDTSVGREGWYVDDVQVQSCVVANHAPVANDDVFTVAKNSPAVLLDAPANDTDPDPGAHLSIIAVGTPDQGGNAAVVDENGSLALPGKFVEYTPAVDFTGVEVFTYTISDGALSDAAVITITVLAPHLNIVKRVEGEGGGTANLLGNEMITYTITLSSASPATATDVVLTDTLPLSITFGGWIQQNGAEYYPNGGTVQLPGGSVALPNESIAWGPGTVANGVPQTFVFSATIDSDANGVIVNRAWYTSGNAGAGWSNEAAITVGAQRFTHYLPLVMKQ